MSERAQPPRRPLEHLELRAKEVGTNYVKKLSQERFVGGLRRDETRSHIAGISLPHGGKKNWYGYAAAFHQGKRS